MTVTIGRRELLAALGGAAAWPLAARAQQTGKVWRIGFLAGSSRESFSRLYAGFQLGMRELGYVEGKDFVSEVHVADGDYERIPGLAADLVRLKFDVIVTGLTAGIRTLQQATATIPIVMAYSTDPVGNGFVASLAQPGGNITGLTGSSDDSAPKQLELLITLVPNASRIGLLGNPATPTYSSVLKITQNIARKAGLAVVPMEAGNPQQIRKAFAAFVEERVQAVMVAADAVFFLRLQQVAELAIVHRLPTMFSQREFAEAGLW
jgi:putative ABC transport system substrate-binding protein